MGQLDKDKAMEPHREEPEGTELTTNQGVRIRDNQNSLKAGDRGPTLLEDFLFREKMTHFDHERIPERIVHARGSGAHGEFQVYESLADLTCAAFLQDPKVKTPVFVRFSTVVGFRGSMDTPRDVRGFATKFYTSDGVFDLVGNNMPVFFIQDAMKFPDLVHSIKPEPHWEIPQAAAAHDTFWDFASLMPECTHMLMWVTSDRALPKSYRTMEGFGVHTFRLVNAQGKSRFVKFHWKPVMGLDSITWDEAQKLAGKDPDFNRRDLWEAIEAGAFPEWELGLQIVEEDDEFRFDFDLLDPTKLIPEELVPVRRVGRMTLNRNPDNFFAETEQVAFHPGHVVPGIDFTNDPLLQGRLFSYLDTQLLRLGGPNFSEIPINRPLNGVHNNQRDGFMRQTVHRGRVSYEPNSLGGGCPMQSPQGFASYAERIDAPKVRARSDSFRDHFKQARLFWNSQTPIEKAHIVEAFRFELGKVGTMEIRQRVVHLLANVDRRLAEQVAEGIGVEDTSGDLSYLERFTTAPRPRDPMQEHDQASEPLSVHKNRVPSLKTRKVAALVADGFDDRVLAELTKAVEAEGGKVGLVSLTLGPVQAASGDRVSVHESFPLTGSIMYDAVFVPGGEASVNALRNLGKAVHFVNEAFTHCKALGGSAEGAAWLAELLPQGDLAPGVVGDDLEGFLEAARQGRHWVRPTKDRIPS